MRFTKERAGPCRCCGNTIPLEIDECPVCNFSRGQSVHLLAMLCNIFGVIFIFGGVTIIISIPLFMLGSVLRSPADFKQMEIYNA